MKINLFVVRHGHSPFVGHEDFKRPLSEKGNNQTQSAGTFIAQNLTAGSSKLITSAAQRTLSSAEQIAKSIPQVQINKYSDLYSASVGDWCHVITEHRIENLILVGHNPTISQLYQYLSQGNAIAFTPATVGHLTLELATDGLKLPAQPLQIFCPKV